MAVGGLVVVRKRAIKWILPWCEIRGNQIMAIRAVGVIEPAITLCPVRVPGAGAIWSWIASAGLFTNPKNGRDDLFFPGEAFARPGQRRRIRFCRGRVRIDLQQGVVQWLARFLAELH